jgi:D-glycero-alpha-D-manno-heptose-7-phosphate kinase
MTVAATAPNRIDLAGGTLDLYPIYLLLDGVVTVNAAITVMSRARIAPRNDGAFHFFAEDSGKKASFRGLDSFKFGGPFDLPMRIIQHYRPKTGLDVYTGNDAPFGSGLGASSALLVALSAAILKYNGCPALPTDIIMQGADIESRVIGVPTGKQDYVAAAYGGLSAVICGVGEPKRMEIPGSASFLEELDASLVLAFTGKSHFSALNNWTIIKKAVDKNKKVIGNLNYIRDVSNAMHSAVRQGDIGKIGKLVSLEWKERRKLARGVSSKRIDGMISAAHKAGAFGAKLCGAGGGGCLIAIAPRKNRAAVARAVEERGAKILEARIARTGLAVSVSNE